MGTVLEALSELTGSPVQVQDVVETLDAEGDQRREEARRRIAAPRRAGKVKGSALPAPEGDWSVPEQLAEQRRRDL